MLPLPAPALSSCSGAFNGVNDEPASGGPHFRFSTPEFVRAFRERRQVRRQRGITGSPVRPRRPRPVGRRLQPVAQPRSPPARRAANADEIRALVAAGG